MQGMGEKSVRNGSAEQIIYNLGIERRLWLAVVMQAVEEWRSGTLRNKRLAQQFLFDDSNDFQSVCANAGLDPDNLRSKLLKIGRRVNTTGTLAHSMAA
jgi:hypothetical protein